MKKSLLLPIAFLAVFILVVSAACSLPFGGGKTTTEEPQVVVVTATPEKVNNVVTAEPDVQETEEVFDESTEESSSYDDALPYYVEEFDGDLSNYSWDLVNGGNGSSDNAYVEPIDGALNFDIEDEQLYTYVYYDAYDYTDVRIDIEADNLATNNNSITLFCRYNPDLGWYEFNIDNDGEWTLYYYDAVVAGGYVQLYDGGSTAINIGRDTNTYTMICQGQEISLYINGVYTHTTEHKDLKEGQIGFGVSSYEVYPVKVNVNWLEISEP